MCALYRIVFHHHVCQLLRGMRAPDWCCDHPIDASVGNGYQCGHPTIVDGVLPVVVLTSEPDHTPVYTWYSSGSNGTDYKECSVVLPSYPFAALSAKLMVYVVSFI